MQRSAPHGLDNEPFIGHRPRLASTLPTTLNDISQQKSCEVGSADLTPQDSRRKNTMD